MHNSDRNRSSDSPFGGLVLIFLIAFVWVLVETWPWWLAVPPFIFAVALIVNDGFRSRVVKIAGTRQLEPDLATLRKKVLRYALALGVMSALICAVGAGLSEMAFWLVPIVSFAVVLRLRMVTIKEGHWSRFRRALYENILELLLISVAVLVFYSIVLAWLQSVPLVTATLGKLESWDRGVYRAHEWLDDHQPSIKILLALSGLVMFLRLVAATWPALAHLAAKTSVLLVNGVKWSERISTAVALAASLTFLATEEGGPGRQIGLTIRDAKQEYEHFQSTVTGRVDAKLRAVLLAKAWNERPAALKKEMANSAFFQNERAKFEDERAKAEQLFQVQPASTENFPLSADLPQAWVTDEVPQKVPATDASPIDQAWTPMQIHDASKEAENLRPASFAEEPKEESGPIDDMTKEAFDRIFPADKLYARAPITAFLKVHYPVFSEFLDAVSYSVSEALFDSMRDSIARRVVQKRRTQPNGSIDTLVSEQVVMEVSAVHLEWTHFDEGWSERTRVRIDSYRAAIPVAEDRLEKLASGKRRQRFENAVQLEEGKRDLMAKVGRALESKQLADQATLMKSYVAELVGLGKDWPAIKEATAYQQELMKNLDAQIQESLLRYPERQPHHSLVAGAASGALIDKAKIQSEFLSRKETPIESVERHPMHLASDSPSIVSTPIDEISFMGSYCDEAILRDVANYADSEIESSKLRMVLGDRYTIYYNTWQNRVEEKKKQEVERNKAEARKAVDLERQRALDEARKAAEHGYDHPVEGR
jgi:hypothetical protein